MSKVQLRVDPDWSYHFYPVDSSGETITTTTAPPKFGFAPATTVTAAAAPATTITAVTTSVVTTTGKLKTNCFVWKV